MVNTTQQDISLLDINLSNARSENESYEGYRNRLKTNKQILKTYFTMGRDAFREMFPNGVGEAMQQANDNASEQGATDNVEEVQIQGSLHLGGEESIENN